ncbi:unnamed protein product, partial [Cylindrotheca closterium]
SEDEDLPDLATEADRGLQFIQSRRKERDPFGLYDHVIMDSGCTTICNVYHDEDGIANVLAMREMIAAGYRITLDTDADNAFIEHCDGNRKMRFVNRKGIPGASTLKGKSTRPTPKKRYNDFFSPPEELYQHNQSITVCIDHMEIENAKFLTCIDTTVRYRSCNPMQNLKTDPEFEALDKIFRRYNKAGFQVKIIKCDRAFIPLTDDMLDNMGDTTRVTWLLNLDNMFMQLERIPTI